MDTRTEIPTLISRRTARWLIASVLLTAGACDSDTTMDERADDLALRQATTAGVVGMGLGDGRSWVVTDDGQLEGWGEPYCSSTGCLAPASIAPIELGMAALEVHGNGELAIARLADGSVVTWTTSASGASTPMPLTFSATEAAAQLALGDGFACARLQGGSVKCLGIGASQAPASVLQPQLAGPTQEISAGAHHACAVLTTGTVECWGANESGQLSVPSTVTSARHVVAGGEHSCALLSTGTVRCWGANGSGQLGYEGATPAAVPIPGAVTQVVAGAEHSCSITTDGTLYCWGNDDLGQLGAGEDAGGVRKVGLDGYHAMAVFAGPTAWTTFAVLDDGGLRGWGAEDVGQLGYGDELVGGGGTTFAVGKLPRIIIYDGEDE